MRRTCMIALAMYSCLAGQTVPAQVSGYSDDDFYTLWSPSRFRHSRIVMPVARLKRRLRNTSLDHPHCWAMSAIGYPGLRRSEKARSRRWRLISSRIEDPVA